MSEHSPERSLAFVIDDVSEHKPEFLPEQRSEHRVNPHKSPVRVEITRSNVFFEGWLWGKDTRIKDNEVGGKGVGTVFHGTALAVVAKCVSWIYLVSDFRKIEKCTKRQR